MSAKSKYVITSGLSNFLDFSLDYQGASLLGAEISVIGTSSVDTIFLRSGVSVDFTSSGGGVDKIFLTGRRNDYQYTLAGSSLSISRQENSLFETVKVAAPAIGSDRLIFSDGSASAYALKQATIANQVSSLVLDTSEKSGTFVPVQAQETRVIAIASDPSVIASVMPNVELVVTGSSGTDTVYVKPGSRVDASNLGGGNDVIYLTGQWNEYEKQVIGTKLQFVKRDADQRIIESVLVSASSGGLNDQVYFADGKADTNNIRSGVLNAMATNGAVSAMAISSISGANLNIQTPGLNDIVTMSSNVQSLSQNQTAIITLNFQDVKSNLTLADFKVSNGQLSQLSASPDSKTWTLVLTPTQNIESEFAKVGMLGQYRGASGILPCASIAIDTRGPDVNIVPIAQDNQINAQEAQQTVLVNGTLEQGGTLAWKSEAMSSPQAVTVVNGQWSVSLNAADLQAASQGAHSIQFWSTDVNGNVAQHSHSYLIDTIAPSLSISTISQDNQVILNQENLTLQGTFSNDVTSYQLELDSTLLQSAANAGQSTWSYYLSISDLANISLGAHQVSMRVRDQAGNQTQVIQNFDLIPPYILLSSPLNQTPHLDPMSTLVLQASETVSAVAGKRIRLVDDGGAGYAGESFQHTQSWDVTNSQAIQIVGNKIYISPLFDLDFSANYHIEVDDGAFVGASGRNTQGISDSTIIHFSTVTPIGGPSTNPSMAAASVKINANGALVNSFNWWDIRGIGSGDSGLSAGNFSLANKSVAMIFKDYDPNPIDSGTGVGIGVGNPSFQFGAIDFGVDDLLYVDDQFNNIANQNNLAWVGGLHGGHAPTTLLFDSYQGLPNQDKKGPGIIQVSIENSNSGFDDYTAWVSIMNSVPMVSA